MQEGSGKVAGSRAAKGEQTWSSTAAGWWLCSRQALTLCSAHKSPVESLGAAVRVLFVAVQGAVAGVASRASVLGRPLAAPAG